MIEVIGIKVFYPLTFLWVCGLAIAVTIFSLYIHKKMVNQEKMEEVRKRMEEHQKKYMEAKKSGDKKLIARLENEQDEIMRAFKENMYQSLKPLFITTPIVLLLLWVMGSAYGPLGAIIELPFGIPFLTRAFQDAGIQNGIDWLGLYILIALVVSIIGQIILKRAKGGKK